MTVYLEGGSACGKSRLGEEWAVFLHRGSPGPLLYLATMEAGDGESQGRIARHRAARCGIAAEVVCGIPLYHKFPGKEAPRL